MGVGSVVSIVYTPPGGSPQDVTNACEFATWHFNSQMAAMPGQFEGIVRDPDHTLSFITGGEIVLTCDGVALWGGYILNATKQFAVPVDDTTHGAAAVLSRQWALSGSDYNYQLDKLIFRNTSSYTTQVIVSGPVYDGALIRSHLPSFLDLPSGFDFSTYVVDTFQFSGSYVFSDGQNGQGFPVRAVLNDLAQYGSVCYMGPDKKLRFMPVQNVTAPFGFSDVPDGTTFIGFASGSATEDITPMGNDAFVWGGSAWAGSGSVVFSRRTNSTSVTDHGRWQYAEVRVGDLKIQAQTDARANVIVSGNVTGSTTDGQQGIALPEQTYKLTWTSMRSPRVAGVPQTIYPGDVTTIELWTFSTDGGSTPWTVSVPCRSIDISFPGLAPDGSAYVQFEGAFGLLVSDPEWLWSYLRRDLAGFRQRINPGGTYTTVGIGGSGAVPYGSLWNGAPSPAPNGSATVFTVIDGGSTTHGYIAGTTQLWLNGLVQVLGTDYTESDPANGQITWISTARTPLITGDTLWLVCKVLG